MTREWKPGDVALVTWPNGTSEVLFRVLGGPDFDIPEWQSAEDGCGYPRPDRLRPLVVIDAEDREQVERLAEASYDAIHKPGAFAALSEMSRGVLINLMQAALREFADPSEPKPDEPTGFLALVEEPEAYRQWYRDGESDDYPWRQRRDDGVHTRTSWGELSSDVRVLSEGVTEGGAS